MFKVKLLSSLTVMLALLSFNLHAINTEPIPKTPEQKKETMKLKAKPKEFPQMDWRKKNTKKTTPTSKPKEFPGLEWKKDKPSN